MESNELKFELRSEEIFPNGFSLEDFEKTFKENQNVIKNNRNIIKKFTFRRCRNSYKIIQEA